MKLTKITTDYPSLTGARIECPSPQLSIMLCSTSHDRPEKNVAAVVIEETITKKS